MKLKDVIDNVDFRNLQWGVQCVQPVQISARHDYTDEDISSNFEILEHYNGIMPSQTQVLPSCVAESLVDLVEWHIFNTTGDAVSLDAIPLFREARSVYWKEHNVDAGGLFMGQAAYTAIEMGIVPPSTKVRHVTMTPRGVYTALKNSPLSIATYVDSGWTSESLDPKTGQINELEGVLPLYAHSTLAVGTNLHNDVPLLVGLNHWGSEWGIGGLFCMSFRRFLNTYVQPAIYLEIDKEDFNNWDGYKDYIIEHPKMEE